MLIASPMTSTHLLVPVVHRPATVREAAAVVLSGPPGACMTPSRVKKVLTISFLISSSPSIGSPAWVKPTAGYDCHSAAKLIA